MISWDISNAVISWNKEYDVISFSAVPAGLVVALGLVLLVVQQLLLEGSLGLRLVDLDIRLDRVFPDVLEHLAQRVTQNALGLAFWSVGERKKWPCTTYSARIRDVGSLLPRCSSPIAPMLASLPRASRDDVRSRAAGAGAGSSRAAGTCAPRSRRSGRGCTARACTDRRGAAPRSVRQRPLAARLLLILLAAGPTQAVTLPAVAGRAGPDLLACIVVAGLGDPAPKPCCVRRRTRGVAAWALTGAQGEARSGQWLIQGARGALGRRAAWEAWWVQRTCLWWTGG